MNIVLWLLASFVFAVILLPDWPSSKKEDKQDEQFHIRATQYIPGKETYCIQYSTNGKSWETLTQGWVVPGTFPDPEFPILFVDAVDPNPFERAVEFAKQFQSMADVKHHLAEEKKKFETALAGRPQNQPIHAPGKEWTWSRPKSDTKPTPPLPTYFFKVNRQLGDGRTHHWSATIVVPPENKTLADDYNSCFATARDAVGSGEFVVDAFTPIVPRK